MEINDSVRNIIEDLYLDNDEVTVNVLYLIAKMDEKSAMVIKNLYDAGYHVSSYDVAAFNMHKNVCTLLEDVKRHEKAVNGKLFLIKDDIRKENYVYQGRKAFSGERTPEWPRKSAIGEDLMVHEYDIEVSDLKRKLGDISFATFEREVLGFLLEKEKDTPGIIQAYFEQERLKMLNDMICGNSSNVLFNEINEQSLRNDAALPENREVLAQEMLKVESMIGRLLKTDCSLSNDDEMPINYEEMRLNSANKSLAALDKSIIELTKSNKKYFKKRVIFLLVSLLGAGGAIASAFIFNQILGDLYWLAYGPSIVTMWTASAISSRFRRKYNTTKLELNENLRSRESFENEKNRSSEILNAEKEANLRESVMREFHLNKELINCFEMLDMLSLELYGMTYNDYHDQKEYTTNNLFKGDKDYNTPFSF